MKLHGTLRQAMPWTFSKLHAMRKSGSFRLYATATAMVCSGFITAVCIVAVGQNQANYLSRKLPAVVDGLLQGASKQNSLEFVGYEPSVWEQEILGSILKLKAQPELVCDNRTINATTRTRLQMWLNTTTFQSEAGGLQLNTDVFSRLLYKNAATGEAVVTYIEPLVRHFRHPCQPPPRCVVPGIMIGPWSANPVRGVDIQDRSYLLLLDLHDGLMPLPRAYPGRRYLFDLGTGLYPTGLTWFVENYGRRGVVFDEIWAWEVSKHDPSDYWGQVPPAVKPALHFYNIPATDVASSPENPLSILKKVYRPGDFVVFKLDIDNAPLERSIFQQILEDPQLVAAIAEMMYEMHYDHPDMRPWFGSPSGQWEEVLHTFVQARRAGIRLHYWP